MIKIETLYIRPEYDKDLLERNTDLAGFVIDKLTNKVKDVAIIQRGSLGAWYEKRRAEFIEDKFYFCIASLSLIGVLVGVETRSVDEKEPQATRDNYRVN